VEGNGIAVAEKSLHCYIQTIPGVVEEKQAET
jgi:hypothetical protein